MCRVIEDMIREERKNASKESMKLVAHRMLKAGEYALEEISSITGLSLDEVAKLQLAGNA